MYVLEQQRPAPAPIPGLAHATWAGHDEGLSQLSLWRQTLAPGAAMVCSVILDRYLGFAEMEGVVSSSATQDSNLANNIHAFSLFGGLVELIQRDGFESP